MDDYGVVAITRERLNSLLLNLMVLNFGPVEEFLETLLTPPDTKQVQAGLTELANMGALSESFELNRYGRLLANLHVEPQLGQLLVYASIFGCVESISSVAAYLSFKDIFIPPLGHKRGRKEIKKGGNFKEEFAKTLEELDGGKHSDHLIRSSAMDEFMSLQNRSEKENFCLDNNTNYDTMVQLCSMRKHICNNLVRNQLIKNTPKPIQGQDYCGQIASSVICAGLYPNIAQPSIEEIEDKAGKKKTRSILLRPQKEKAQKMVYTPQSINASIGLTRSCMAYFMAVHTNELFARETTLCSFIALALCARELTYEDDCWLCIDKFYR